MNTLTQIAWVFSAVLVAPFLSGCYWGGAGQIIYEQHNRDLMEQGYFDRQYKSEDGYTGTLRFTRDGVYFIPSNSVQRLSKFDEDILSDMAAPWGGMKDKQFDIPDKQ